MDNWFTYTTKQGLKVIFIKKEGFVKGFCGIGCKYGGANARFTSNHKEIRSPYGIAHFIEHKLFRMPDGSDAFMTFNTQNASANAYTASDKTIYYFTKNEDISDSLKLLLEMYFTPVFTKEDIEREKSIIISEIRMYEDNVGYQITQQGVSLLYPKDDYSYPITGDEKSVKETTPEDMYEAYHAFYTPQNSVLCIVGDYDKEQLFSFIEDVLSRLEFLPAETKKLKTIESLAPLAPMTVKERVSQDEVLILVRMDKMTNQDALGCEKLLGVLESILSVSSAFYQSLSRRRLFDNDIDYQVITYSESSYLMISAPSRKPETFAKAVIKKLKTLSEEDIDSKLTELYLKHLKAKSILNQDSVEALGDTVLSLALEDIDYFRSLEDILALTGEDLKECLDIISSGQMTWLITKKSEKSTN